MTKNPLHPCRSNKWFQAELRTLKLLWPFGIEDSFTRSPDTGLFQLTPEFQRRSDDINCWTFGPDMYEEFPMIFGAAPSRGTIPGRMNRPGGRKPVTRYIEYKNVGHMNRADDGIKVEDKTAREELQQRIVQNGVMGMMQLDGLDYNNLNWREEEREGKHIMYFTLW
jgi:hypothetical protein